jgi:UDP:flavonoid glycosyltransferase YjiC (YdhE family)
MVAGWMIPFERLTIPCPHNQPRNVFADIQSPGLLVRAALVRSPALAEPAAHQAGFVRVDHGLHPVAQAELHQHPTDVCLHGRLGHIQTVPEFESTFRAPATLTFAGPLLDAAPRFELPAWWTDLNSGRRVVHVTQGTLDNADLSKVIQPTVAALADQDLLVVVATGGRPVSELRMALPDNVRVAEMLPYAELLPKIDAMVTNGGYGGVQMALAHGLPLIVAGAREDKPEVAARVAWSGSGVNLRVERPVPDVIGEAVSDVLTKPGYRGNARRLAGGNLQDGSAAHAR